MNTCICFFFLFMQCTYNLCNHVDHIFHLILYSLYPSYIHIIMLPSIMFTFSITHLYIQSCCILSCKLSLSFMYYIPHQITSLLSFKLIISFISITTCSCFTVIRIYIMSCHVQVIISILLTLTLSSYHIHSTIISSIQLLHHKAYEYRYTLPPHINHALITVFNS